MAVVDGFWMSNIVAGFRVAMHHVCELELVSPGAGTGSWGGSISGGLLVVSVLGAGCGVGWVWLRWLVRFGRVFWGVSSGVYVICLFAAEIFIGLRQAVIGCCFVGRFAVVNEVGWA